MSASPSHPIFTRRSAVQAGAISLLGLTSPHLARLQAAAPSEPPSKPRAQRVIFIFLSGGLAQHESFDPKPLAPDEVRGEFAPIATQTPGIHISEHLPGLAARSADWALVRSLTHPYNDHSQGHMAMLSGRTPLPIGFSSNEPQPNDHPSIAAVASAMTVAQNNLPPAVILPEKLIHRTGRVIPGQLAGQMGTQRDPFLLTCCRFNPQSYGAWPQYGFDHQTGVASSQGLEFLAPNLALPENMTAAHWQDRVGLLRQIEQQRRQLEAMAEVESFDRFQQRAISMLAQGDMQKVFDIQSADDGTLERYGRHTFGWSLLLARRLVEAGVHLVQVNLGNNETWDTHGNAFPHLRNYLLPPMDQAVSALLDDLRERGLLDSTLLVMAGEFGRTPKISHLPQHYALPGRDHWGRVQTVWLAGGGVRGGTVIGATDKLGGEPIEAPQTPENLAATIYHALGIPPLSTWHDLLDRPIPVYYGEPIAGLT